MSRPLIAIVHADQTAEDLAGVLQLSDMDTETFEFVKDAIPAFQTKKYDGIISYIEAAPGIGYEAVDPNGVMIKAMRVMPKGIPQYWRLVVHMVDEARFGANTDTPILIHTYAKIKDYQQAIDQLEARGVQFHHDFINPNKFAEQVMDLITSPVPR